MPTLHTINKSPCERSSAKSCLDHVMEGDAVLMIEDAVLGARKGGTFVRVLKAERPACAVYVLGPDLAARGMRTEDLAEGISVIDYGGFVDLAVANARVCAWL
ncbi:MAG TPA: sulfurtransferase complex subunit TusB [Bradyrhizobium sp.]|nr:sulfurtransferase complex subunit TusB [Bradyrhizobium sp.]